MFMKIFVMAHDLYLLSYSSCYKIRGKVHEKQGLKSLWVQE